VVKYIIEPIKESVKVNKENKNSLNCKIKNKKPNDIVWAKPSIKLIINPNFIKINELWIEKELNNKINKLKYGKENIIIKKE